MTMKWQQRKLKKAVLALMDEGTVTQCKIHQIYFELNFQKEQKYAINKLYNSIIN